MASASREQVPVSFEDESFGEARTLDVAGTTISFERWKKGIDIAPLFKGLPDDMCQCPHSGFLFKGRMRWHTKDGEEIVEAGQAYHFEAGHIPEILEDCELVEFSPTVELGATMAQAEKNMAALQSAHA